MSRSNPRKAMAALLPTPVRIEGYDLAVKPMTLGMWAALERISSPLVTGRQDADALDLVPSLYLLTHDPCEVFAGDLLRDAMAWADSVGVDALAKIRAAVHRQIAAACDVIPETDEPPKKKRTAGARRSRASQPRR